MNEIIKLRQIESSEPLKNLDRICDMEIGRISGKVFVDKEIYEQELEKIFARCWLFVAHESQLPKFGDYLTTTMGEDEVLVVRQKDESIKVMLNACPLRGTKVCFAEAGNSHGWSFGSDGGRLLGMHESKCYEKSNFDKTQHGLRQARVASYKGLVFATFAADAPSLEEYLGPMTWYLDVMLDMDEGGSEFLGGCIRSTIDCNWKIAAENFGGDILHGGWTHDSAAKAMLGMPVANVGELPESYSVNWNGHGYEFATDVIGNAATLGERDINKYLHTLRPQVAERLGEFRSKLIGAISSFTVFPNFSFLPGQNTVRVWQPRGPDKIELYTWVIVNKNAPQEIKDKWRRGAMMTFSPTGVFEMDDGENWEYCTKTSRGMVTRYQDMYVGLGMNSRIENSELPGNVFRGQLNECNARAFYQRWKDLLESSTWADVPDRNGKLC
jgi:ethylbenzene dioxygenase alpha subunit